MEVQPMGPCSASSAVSPHRSIGAGRAFAALALVCWLAGAADAQEFRIYTRVYDAAAQVDGKAAVIGRSLSLFHAGKVYDYVENGPESEVIIFEPAHDRFVVLNTSRNLATTIHFDEVRQKMQIARQVTEERIAELEQRRPPVAPQTLAKLRFPLNPNFSEKLDAGAKRLTLSSPHLEYSVAFAEVEDRESVEFYLNYADWIAQLNYILHPHALYPQPRLALDEHLRSAGYMPVEVRLDSRIGLPMSLRAEHEIVWKLDSRDRSDIHQWESLLRSDLTEHVPLQKYQQLLLISQASRRR
jgi:hypothetical protein